MADEKPQPTAETPTPESAVITGGPGVSTPSTAPELRPVKIGGREFQAPPDMAEALEKRERDYEAGIQKQGQELGELRGRLREWESQQERLRTALAPQGAQPAEPDIETELFTNPRAALARHERQILSRLEQQRQVETDREKFWRDFYGSHRDLSRDDDHWLVETILQRNFRDLATLPVDEGHKKLGDLTRQAMLRIMKRAPGSASGSPRTTVEGASAARSDRSVAPAAEDDGPNSLTEAINAKRARKRAPVVAKAS